MYEEQVPTGGGWRGFMNTCSTQYKGSIRRYYFYPATTKPTKKTGINSQGDFYTISTGSRDGAMERTGLRYGTRFVRWRQSSLSACRAIWQLELIMIHQRSPKSWRSLGVCLFRRRILGSKEWTLWLRAPPKRERGG